MLICGAFYDGNYDHPCAVAFRLNSNGIPDPTFSNDLTGSYFQTNDNNVDITSIGCSLFDNNKSIAAFTYEDPNVLSLMLAKFTSAGDEDLTFDDDGVKFVTLFDGLRISDIKDDGTNMYLCGYFKDFDSNLSVVIKIDQNGNFISGFANNGFSDLGNDADESAPQALCLTEDGSVFATGQDVSGNAFVAKLNSDGFMDFSFGTSGFAYYNNSTDPIGLTISVTPTGQITIAGKEFDEEGLNQSFIARFNVDGTPDNNFDVDGICRPEFDFEEDILIGLHILNDGDLLTTGYGNMTENRDQFICAKFNISGVGVLIGGQSKVRYLSESRYRRIIHSLK